METKNDLSNLISKSSLRKRRDTPKQGNGVALNLSLSAIKIIHKEIRLFYYIYIFFFSFYLTRSPRQTFTLEWETSRYYQNIIFILFLSRSWIVLWIG